LIGLSLYFAQPDKKWAWTFAWAIGAALWIGLLALHFQEILLYLISQRGRMGANAMLSSIFALGVLSLLVYIADRHNASVDWTKTKRHTLSPQTLRVVRNINKEVNAIAFYDVNSQEFVRVRDLLKRYEAANPKIKTRVVDPRIEPALARQYEVTGTGVTVFEADGKRERVSFGSEKEFTGALIKVTKDKKPTLYFLQGHGEHTYDSFADEGYGALKSGLERLNYQVKELKLLTEKTIPKDCDVLVIGGAQRDLFPQEKQAIKSYLDKGGKIMLMLEPEPAPSFSDWLDEWGLEAKTGMVVEPANNILADAAAIFTFGFRFHDITRPFQKARQEAVLFITARPIKRKTQTPSGVTLTELIETSASSWREEKLQGVVRKEPDEESGPFILAAAVEKNVTGKKKMRVVVIADSDFATNQFIRNLLNGAFAANCIHWLAEEDVLIDIPPKDEPPQT
ncbi:MAG: GldG family protein, partial [Armatimonadetes bacterium]|nr:GldG family protein [Armatimonadota bacterium]